MAVTRFGPEAPELTTEVTAAGTTAGTAEGSTAAGTLAGDRAWASASAPPVMRFDDDRTMIPATTSSRPVPAPARARDVDRMCSPSNKPPRRTLAIGWAALIAGRDHRIGPLWNELWTNSTTTRVAAANA